MLPSEFRYHDNFPSLTDEQIAEAIDVVEVTWYGLITQCWAVLPSDIRDRKRELVENYLVAWYLTDQYPSSVEGVVSNGGMPLTQKTIEDTSVSFADIPLQDNLKVLASNRFGLLAAQMILSAPERYQVYG